MSHDPLSLALSSKTLEFIEYPISVLLVDDQPIVAEAVRQMFEDCPDITLHYCQNPSKAVEMASTVNPTVILQDLIMPEIDGLMLVRFFRANPATKDVPLIVLSTKEEPEIKQSAFVLGANDYIVKLPDKVEFLARIRYHSNSYIRLLERNEAYEKLIKSQKLLQAELSEAASYVRSLLPLPLTGEITTWWKFIPSTQLGGDSFGYHWIDDDHFAIYLLDVCGHGVGAALLSISIANELRSQNLSNVDFHNPSSVFHALNMLYPMEKHGEKFSTMWYGVFNKKSRELKYSSAGHPPAILLNGRNYETSKLYLLNTKDVVIGGVQNVEFKTGCVLIEEFNKLYIFSDGVYEQKKSDGKYLVFEEFANFIRKNAKPAGSDLDDIEAFARSFDVHGTFNDDFSIIQTMFSPVK